MLAPLRPGSASKALAPAVAQIGDWWRQSQERARSSLNDFLTPALAGVANVVSPQVRAAPGAGLFTALCSQGCMLYKGLMFRKMHVVLWIPMILYTILIASMQGSPLPCMFHPILCVPKLWPVVFTLSALKGL